MFFNENKLNHLPPLYPVEELSMEEALLLLAAEKELAQLGGPAKTSHDRQTLNDFTSEAIAV